MSNLILKWRSFGYKEKFEKRTPLFRSQICIFDIFFKRLYKEILKSYKPIVIKNFKLVPLCPIT